MNVLSQGLMYGRLRSLVCIHLLVFIVSFITVIPAFSATAKGVTLRQLTNDGKSSFVNGGGGCAPVGNNLAYYKEVGEGTYELCVMDLDTGKSVAVSNVGFPCAATWSHDGSKLAYIFANTVDFASEATVMVWDAESGRTTRTSMRDRLGKFNVEYRFFLPRWSPDNKHLAMQTSAEDGSLQLFVFPAGAGTIHQIAPNNPANLLTEIRPPNIWAADSSRLAYINWQSNQLGQIWTSDPEAKGLKRISEDFTNLWGLAWSWDGEQIAFTTSRNRSEEERQEGFADIWVMNADGSRFRPVTRGSATSLEERATWRIFDFTRDNRYILAWFEQMDEKGDRRYAGFDAADPNTGEIIHALYFETNTSDQLYLDPYNGWAESWDGQRLAFVGTQYTVYGPREDPRRENERRLIRVFSIPDQKTEDILTYRPDQDRFTFYTDYRISWTSDNSSLVVPRIRIISESPRRVEEDLVLVSLPFAQEIPATPPTTQPEAAAPTTGEAAPCVGIIELPILNRPAEEVADLLPSSLKGTFNVDKNRNSLMISSDSSNLESLKQCINSLDKPVPQIMVSVLAAELGKDANRQLGLDWEFARHRFGGTLPFGSGLSTGSIFWEGVGQLDEEFFTELSLLADEGKAVVRVSPRVLATSGKEASMTIRRTDFFVFTTATSYGVSQQRSDISADTILKITPVLLGDGRISVSVDATVDSFTFSGGDDLPDTTRRQAVTEVICDNGETIIIGGLTQQDTSKTIHKTPLLGDLPIFGQFFRHSQTQEYESTLVLFITPRISTGISTEERAVLETNLNGLSDRPTAAQQR